MFRKKLWKTVQTLKAASKVVFRIRKNSKMMKNANSVQKSRKAKSCLENLDQLSFEVKLLIF